MPNLSFIKAVQARTARVAVGPSAVRGQGGGCSIAARQFFESLDLKRLSRSSVKTFHAELDAVTKELLYALPENSRAWGLSRKLVNIFLRDAFYITYLNEAYCLTRIEPFLEIPLDSITAKKIKKSVRRGELPPWPGVRHLPFDISKQFQAAAEKEALKYKVQRVHLDTFWWGQRSLKPDPLLNT